MIVSDTNLIAYFFIKGPFTEPARRALRRDRHWVAPPLWRYELLNVVATTFRQGLLDESQARRTIKEAGHLVREREHYRPWDVVELSARTKAAAYDCEFLVLAKKLKVPLVTADHYLLKIFPETAISIEEFAGGS